MGPNSNFIWPTILKAILGNETLEGKMLFFLSLSAGEQAINLKLATISSY
jgi:hypothetical protein